MEEPKSPRYRLSPSAFYRVYDGETVAYDTGRRRVYRMNGTAADVLDCFDRYRSADEAAERLLGLYDVPDEAAFRRDIADFVRTLVDRHLLVAEHRQVRRLDDLENELSAAVAGSDQLLSVMMELTYHCNERCRHCYVVDEGRREMDLGTVRRILDELAELNVLNVVFTGGEVFTRRDAFDILEYAYEKRFVVDIFTNGTLIDGDDYIRLKRLWPRCVHFSLYSPVPERHDAVTRVVGSFERTLRSIRACHDIGIPVNIKAPLFSETRDDVEGIVALANEVGCSVELGPSLTPKKDGDLAPLEMGIRPGADEDRVIGAMRELVETVGDLAPRDGEAESLCGAGGRTLCVNPYGEVFPCALLQLKVGDVHESSMREIWTGSERLAWWRDHNRRSFRKGCEGCELIDDCVFCPGEALMRTGDPLCRYEEACRKTRRVTNRLNEA